ncbi:uncharacterized protein BYT42DRAFT_488202 [Radiomyces spectabilis]|uniref:uncharacterized protein n=1 Tax=Radiomyces spectabilis TaxID=64574 RepID=UPI002220A4DD|nr:uncharacterized protein BYT42DRAFT_488202 [Radiomyces spectabilis]KAI8393541.1 hypothetical protein BYT42DRAFT_488202 [Radiomyces spectabilis]
MLPLKPREVPFDLKDTITQTELNTFTNLAEVLRFRGTQPSLRDSIAFTLVDAKGKEPTTLTWDKLNAKAQKLAIQIRDRSKVALGDRVALIYRKSEVLDFIVAMFGCFLAGVVAVPINAAEDLSELSFILNLTNATLVLTTDHNLRAFNKDMQSRSIELPGNIDWWKTNDIGTWYPPKKKSEYPPIKLPELAYIEFAKAPNGELKGVTVAHQTIMSECKVYQAAVTETNVTLNDQEGVTLTPQSKSGRPSADCLVSYLEPRQQIGLVVSVLCTIFSGNHSVFTSASVIDTPAVWIYILSKYKATIALADYPSLKFVTHFYQTRTKEVLQYSKKIVPDLSSLRFLFVDTNVVKPDLDEYIADKLLTPLGNTDNPLEVVCPVISLAEHGGFILSFRDNLGPARLEEYVIQEEKEDGSDKPLVTTRSALATGHSKDVWQCLLDVEALKMNKVVVVAAGDEARKTQNMNEPGRVRVGSFGFAIPEATIAIVDPDTTTLCPPDTIGEIWIDAPSLSGGFWALAKHTEAIFHARPIIVPPDTFYPELYNQEFLRTGLCGTMIGGRLVIFGTYEDRIRQQRLGATLGIEETHFTSDIVETLNKRARIEQCAAFEITVNDQHMPIVACESSLDRAELRQVAGDIDEALLEYNGIRVYAVLMVANNALPRHLKHGRRQIHALMVKRAFMAGKLPIRSVKMDVDRTVFNLGMAEDPTVNIWQTSAAYDTAIRTGLLPPVPRQQHTGIEPVEKVVDERTELDLAQFTNIIDVLQWRTKLYPEETAFVSVTHSNNGTANTKAYSWRKMNTKVVSVANYLSKKGYKRGHKALILMPYSVEWIYCIYACFVLGIIAVPIEPPDPQQQSQRIKEDVLSYIGAARELGIDFTVVNSTSDDMLKSKTVHPILKQEVHKYKSYKLPDTVNISKASRTDKLLGRESGWSVRAEWAKNYSVPCMISIQYGADATKFYSYLNHATIMNQCRTQKTTCQMKPPRGLVATGLGGFDGLGLLHSVFCGVYVGCVTVVIPLAEFYVNPMTFFEMLQRYKAKDVFVNQALMQYAMNRITPAETRRLSLQAVQNFMLAVNGTPNPILYQHVARYLAGCRLPKGVINNVYSHFANPMVTTRSYMLLEPLPLLADAVWLRQGIIRTLPPEDEPFGVLLHDSGIVPSNTMVAIVNPETQTLCPSGMIGEIWVASDSNIRSFHGLEENARLATFECSIAGTDPRIKYMRTGDLGFLWNVQRRVNNASTMMEEGQCLFVLGAKSEKIERNGLVYFPSFVESSIERSHPALQPGGSVILQIANEIIVIAAIKSSENAVSAVPLIVSAVLEKHAFLIDTVVMIPSHQLPRSRFGDKQRKKTLALYTEKKLSAIYVKRITNQHEPLSMPEWSQSQLSLDYDTMSVRTRPLSIGTRSIAETAVDSDHSHLPRQQEPIGNHRTSLPSTPSKQMSMS